MTKLSTDQKRFHEAAKNDNIAIIKDIINKFVNVKDEEGKTPLQNAESEEIQTYLVKIGADVNVKDSDGNTPLHHAVGDGQVGVAKCLIENGANVNAKNKIEYTPLFDAVCNSEEAVKLLIENGANINVKGKKPALKIYDQFALNTSCL